MCRKGSPEPWCPFPSSPSHNITHNSVRAEEVGHTPSLSSFARKYKGGGSVRRLFGPHYPSHNTLPLIFYSQKMHNCQWLPVKL